MYKTHNSNSNNEWYTIDVYALIRQADYILKLGYKTVWLPFTYKDNMMVEIFKHRKLNVILSPDYTIHNITIKNVNVIVRDFWLLNNDWFKYIADNNILCFDNPPFSIFMSICDKLTAMGVKYMLYHKMTVCLKYKQINIYGNSIYFIGNVKFNNGPLPICLITNINNKQIGYIKELDKKPTNKINRCIPFGIYSGAEMFRLLKHLNKTTILTYDKSYNIPIYNDSSTSGTVHLLHTI